jgi:hypothetical protein
MDIPTVDKAPGATVAGKVSWFGGPHDAETGNNKTATGSPSGAPGIAVYNRATLGGYWKVTAANGKTAVLKQTDLGPAPLTGRAIDVSSGALPSLGYSEGNFPTGATFKATYLGKTPQASAAAPTASLPTATAFAGSPVVVKAATTTKALDLPALEAVNRKVQANRFVASSFGGGEGNPLRGILDLTAPSPSSFETTSSTPAVLAPGAAGGGGAAAAQVPGLTAGGVGSAPISASAPADVKVGANAPAPGKVSLGTPIAKEFPAVYKAKSALERASGHPVSIAEIEKEVAAGTHAHHVVIAPAHGTVVGSYPTPSGQRAIVHHSNGKLEHVASTLPKGHQYLGGAVLGAPIGQQGG